MPNRGLNKLAVVLFGVHGLIPATIWTGLAERLERVPPSASRNGSHMAPCKRKHLLVPFGWKKLDDSVRVINQHYLSARKSKTNASLREGVE